ncbi:QcrA and Rieske domain-containing protein [Planctomicrobium piriforme]|uniref:Menaquinol-cytochrome c reductase iron-sulfur subunit n=1 Tax=Planctomicrobium piriforme TaxID=1576369 RepID=A0A1I3PI33_9PLAN|nr:Rieske 2Fe-2S domain-containing protein [Planctomicrobium piriforme]SFJ21195.1 menaquinol-cytochrome c reductase iron-sulfur subunit [Planctomicrobium piriforme]
MTHSQSPPPADPHHHTLEHAALPPRRNFLLEGIALAIGAIITVIPAIPAMAFILTPLIKPKGKQEIGDGFRMVGKVGSLRPGGPPQLFQVVGLKQDAWTTYPATTLGSVFVRLEPDGKLLCLNARCTHLGCTVGYQPTRESYLCPCHTAAFTLEGQRTNEVPPRNMDSLPVELRNKDEIWVKFQNFRGGCEEKIPV